MALRQRAKLFFVVWPLLAVIGCGRPPAAPVTVPSTATRDATPRATIETGGPTGVHYHVIDTSSRFQKRPLPAALPTETQPYSFAKSPTFESIPNRPASGSLGGRPFVVAFARLRPASNARGGAEAWELTLYPEKPSDPMAALSPAQTFSISLPEIPRTDEFWDFSWGDNPYVAATVVTDGGQNRFNYSSSMILSFTRWDVRPYDLGGPHRQEGGTAAGRIALSMEGFPLDKSPDAWVGGTFEAVAIYPDIPPWIRYPREP